MMNNVDMLVKELEKELKDNPSGMRALNELVTFIGSLETQMSQQDVEIHRLKTSNDALSWNGYVDRQSGAYDATEVAEFHRRDWS